MILSVKQNRFFYFLFIYLFIFNDTYATCSVNATDMDFGYYTPTNPNPTNITSTITMTCTTSNRAIVYTIALSSGLSGNYNNRALKSPSHALYYNLYQDPTHNIIWGDGSGSTKLQRGNIPARKTNYQTTNTVYGSINPLQNLPPNMYSDSITITIIW